MTDWAALPLVLTAKDVAPLLRCSVATVQRKCAQRRMAPPPISYGAGRYTWSRDVVRAWVERGLHTQPQPRKPRLSTTLQVPPMVSAADVRTVAASLLKGA